MGDISIGSMNNYIYSVHYKNGAMKLLLFMTLVSLKLASAYADYYETVSGRRISESEYLEKLNISEVCVKKVEPCGKDEYSRVDGTCNNMMHPSYGATFTPWRRLLDPYHYKKAKEPRETADGRTLPLSRVVATTLLSKGRVSSQELTNLVTNFWLVAVGDVSFPADTANFVNFIPHCCKPEGKFDDACSPNIMPPDDPVHRFSNIRCQNMTVPDSFQSHGCVAKNTPFIRTTSGTPIFDLSFVYGSDMTNLTKRGRLFSGGLLKNRLVNGYEWPSFMKDDDPLKFICLNNVGEEKKVCLSTPNVAVNSLLGSMTFAIWYWRQHNALARELQKHNPCWDDEKLFRKARDINIALYLQTLYYGFSPIVLGRENLIRDGVIQECSGFRDVYDESLVPQISLEYFQALRWVHLLQEGQLKLYDKDGYFTKHFPIVNATLRPGWLATGYNFAEVTQGSFRQPCAEIDYIVDPDISDVGLGPLQESLDIITNDHAKAAHFEFQPYIRYREYCSGKKITCFDDLRDVVDNERLEKLMDLHERVEDIELMAGLWAEKIKKGAKVPDTVYCLAVEQLLHNLRSDRHWYERETRPNAFTYDQLMEIRKATVGGLLCKYGDFVTQIQPQPFLRPGPGNEIDDCDVTTQSIDLSVFKDPNCELEKEK